MLTISHQSPFSETQIIMTHGVIAPVQVDEAWQMMEVLANKVGKLLNWWLCWCFHKPTNEKCLGSDGWTLGEWLERSWLTSHLCKKCGVSDRQKKLVTARLLNLQTLRRCLRRLCAKIRWACSFMFHVFSLTCRHTSPAVASVELFEHKNSPNLLC